MLLMSSHIVKDALLWNTYATSEILQKYVGEEMCGIIDKTKHKALEVSKRISMCPTHDSL